MLNGFASGWYTQKSCYNFQRKVLEENRYNLLKIPSLLLNPLRVVLLSLQLRLDYYWYKTFNSIMRELSYFHDNVTLLWHFSYTLKSSSSYVTSLNTFTCKQLSFFLIDQKCSACIVGRRFWIQNLWKVPGHQRLAAIFPPSHQAFVQLLTNCIMMFLNSHSYWLDFVGRWENHRASG